MSNIRKSFIYSPMRQGYDTNSWRTISGAPSVVGGRLSIDNEAGVAGSAIHYVDFVKGDISFDVNVPVAPVEGTYRIFGVSTPDATAYIRFAIGSELNCEVCDEGNTTVNASLQVNLGADIELCALTSAELDAGNASIPNVKYKWNTGDTTQKYTALKSGTYTVSVSAANCSTVSDTVLVSSKLLNVTNDTLCSAGNALLSVNGTASYNWFDVATGGTALYAGTSYTPLVSATKTYYVEEAGGLSASIGKTSMGTGSSWSLGAAYFTETDKINVVTVTKAVTLESVAVYCTTANTSVTINFKQGATVMYTKTVVASGTGKQTIPLGFTLQPGTYTVDADGTNNALTFEASGATYPYSYDGYIS